MDKMTPTLPYPKCGSEEIAVLELGQDALGGKKFYAECEDCGHSIGWSFSSSDAIAFWNKESAKITCPPYEIVKDA